MRNRKADFLISCTLVVVILFGCQHSKPLQANDKLYVKGWVILPDTTRAVGATVKTDPPTEIVVARRKPQPKVKII